MSSDSFANTRLGTDALTTPGSADLAFNTAVGVNALQFLSTGTNNTAIGYNAGSANLNFNNTTSIGANAIPTDNDQVVLGSIGTTAVAQNFYVEALAPVIDTSTNSFGVVSSSSGILYNKLITDSDIASNANIANSKLAILITPGMVDNIATTATTDNVPLSIVSRDGSANILAITQPVEPIITSDNTVATTLYVNNLLNFVSNISALPDTIARRDEFSDLYASNFYGNLVGDVYGNLIGNFSGDITGNLTGDVLGNLTGNVLGNLTGDVLGNVNGNLLGNVVGTVLGNLNGDVVGNLTGDVVGNVLGNVAGNVNGNLNGDVVGNVLGNVNGNLNGDVVGNVLGNVNGNLIGDVVGNVLGNVNGNLTGDVVGNVLGNVAGNVNGNLNGDVVGNVNGNVLGNVNGNLTGNVVGNVNGNLLGNVNGNVTGSLNGDVTGNLYGSFFGPLAGNLVGNVLGNVNGNVTGSLFGNVNGNVNGNVDGNVSGVFRGTAFADMYGPLVGDVTGNLKGNVIGNLSGNVNGSVTGSVFGSVTGFVVGDVTGNVKGNVTGSLYGNVTGSLVGSVTGSLNGNVVGDVDGDVNGNVVGNVSGSLRGNVTGNVVGNVSGLLRGNVTGSLNGNVVGSLNGNVVGSLNGNVNGDVSGDVTGTLVGDVTGNLHGILHGNVSGNLLGNVTGALFGNATTASSASTSSTQPLGTSNTSIATTQFVNNALNAYSPVLNTVLIDASMCDSSANYFLPSPPSSQIYVKNGDVLSTTDVGFVGNCQVYTSAVINDNIFFGGYFRSSGYTFNSNYNDVSCVLITRCDINTNTFYEIDMSGSGFLFDVNAQCRYVLAVGTDLYVAGIFKFFINGNTIYNIIRYNTLTNTWHPLGRGVYHTFDSFNGYVDSIGYNNNNNCIYVGGVFNTLVQSNGTEEFSNNFAYFNINSQTWFPLSQPGNGANVFCSVGTKMYYAGGGYVGYVDTTTNTVTSLFRVKREPGSGNGSIFTISYGNNLLYMGGQFFELTSLDGSSLFTPGYSLFSYDMNDTNITSASFSNSLKGPTSNYNQKLFNTLFKNNKLYILGGYYIVVNPNSTNANPGIGCLYFDFTANKWINIGKMGEVNESYMVFDNNDTLWMGTRQGSFIGSDVVEPYIQYVTNNVTLKQGTTPITTLNIHNEYALIASTQAASKTFVTPFISSSSNLTII